jgi:nucleotide-binding universal stress UspA family protein
MTIKDILVHVDTSLANHARLMLAIALAHRFGAALFGIFVLPSRKLLELTASEAAVRLALDVVELERHAAAREAEFSGLLRRHGLDGEWQAVRGSAAPCIAQRGRVADLVILGQRDPDRPEILEAPEDVILACGRPVLVVPYAGRFEQIGGDVLVAWNGSREATLAMHDALPLMAPSKSVTLLTVSLRGDRRAEIVSDPVSHLTRHGLNAKGERLPAGDLEPAEATLSRAAEIGADLIVMGAYGHSRLREAVLGGMTRDMLRHMTVPVLMAH